MNRILTLSAIDFHLGMTMKNIAVIGAGVVGLSTAVNIIESIQDIDITVIADRFSPHTTSDVSAGFWKPHAIAGTDAKVVQKWGRSTWKYLSDLALKPEASKIGIQTVSGYETFKSHEPEREYRYIHDRFTDMTSGEMAMYGNGNLSGIFYTTLTIDCYMYIPWLMDRFKKKGGTFLKRKVKDLEDEELEKFDIIVNCTGLGASELVKDKDLIPIRGQVVKVKAPWVKHFLVSNGDCLFYILPGIRQVTLGGTHDENNWNSNPTNEDRQKILEGCFKLLPNLKEAEIIGDYCALRPYRTKGVRLETELITKSNGKKITVVHNYGHGGSGVTIHWGSALDATDLVKCCLKSAMSKL